jgi:hypothetical protein
MKMAKLDAYNYSLLNGIIRITVSGTTDPDLVDIMSEIERANNKIHIEGIYYTYLGTYRVFNRGTHAYLELDVSKMV